MQEKLAGKTESEQSGTEVTSQVVPEAKSEDAEGKTEAASGTAEVCG